MAEVRELIGWVKAKRRRERDRFLRGISGLIHVGANSGQERFLYNGYGVRVLWIEPIPDVFRRLCENIRRYPRQRALQALVTDRDDADYEFHVANNEGQSSSILELAEHRDIWPDVRYVATIPLRSTTLATLMDRAAVDPGDFQALVMDTQGSELLVLQGAVPLLDRFRYVKTEVADFDSYAGCCRLADLEAFMGAHGFREISRRTIATRAGGGNYYDVIYERSK